MVIRCLGKVADAYKLDSKTQRTFKPQGAIHYDNRILGYRQMDKTVSIWTLNGREVMPYQGGERQAELLKHQRGESDLWYTGGVYYLLATCEIDEPTPAEVKEFLGVDRGVINVAVDSDGQTHKASHINHVRHRHRSLRRKLQKKGTKAARRLLRQQARKEARFSNATNHCITKSSVVRAQGTGRRVP